MRDQLAQSGPAAALGNMLFSWQIGASAAGPEFAVVHPPCALCLARAWPLSFSAAPSRWLAAVAAALATVLKRQPQPARATTSAAPLPRVAPLPVAVPPPTAEARPAAGRQP